MNRDYCISSLCWSKPPTGFFKLNIDGTRQGSSGKIGAGGIIRCSSGNWINGFDANLGVGEVLDAETWGLFHGLKLAVSCNIENLQVESDSAIWVKLMLHSDITMHPLGSLLACCKGLMEKFHYFSLKHIYRECNMVADCLAKHSLNHEHEIVEFPLPPIHAQSVLLDDAGEVIRVCRTVAEPPEPFG